MNPGSMTPSNAKAFEKEDELIMYALVAEKEGAYKAATDIYMTLYTNSGKKEYLYRSLELDNQSKNYDAVLERSRKYLEKYPEDATLSRHEIVALSAKGEDETAKSKALELVERTKALKDYLIVSQIYIKARHYDTALKYLERAYAIDYDEKILVEMAKILFVELVRKKEAIAHLETHSRLHGCSKLVCNTLAAFYSEQNELDGMLSTYTRLYKEDESKAEYAQAIIKIYSYKKEFDKLKKFLEETQADDTILLQLYVNAKEFKKASALSKKLYQNEGDITYLGQYAIFKYEGAVDKNDQQMLDEVIRAFKQVLSQTDEALYYNYLGYLLIDHDIDVKGGVQYVKQALTKEPDSPYYKDSLGWGYYKLGKCQKAYRLIDEVQRELGTKDEEVRTHMKAIKKCLKRKNR